MNVADFIVAGGGPAGCIAGIGLAALGHRVRLVTTPRRRAVEGMSERVIQALTTAGCHRAVDVLGPAVRREAGWNGETNAANREWVVDRGRFDDALLEDAAAAGVEVHRGRITRVRRTAGVWHVETAAGARFGGRFLIEARGRRAPGRRRRGPRTTALGQAYRNVPARARTAVASFGGGWAWYASIGDGRAILQIMVSPPLPKRTDLTGFVAELLGELPSARDWRGAGEPTGAVFARDADTGLAGPLIRDGLIRIGDAALAPDPLSGHGVFEALASATAAIAVVNTMVRHPDDDALARAFYEERTELAFERFARIGRDFYALEQRWPEARFWAERRAWPDDRPAHAPLHAASPEVAEKPVVADGFVVRRRVVVTPDQPRGVWQVAGVSLVDLLDWLEGDGANCADPTDAAARRFGRSRAELETAVGWLRFRGMIGPIER